jgi:hypothetical protein
MISNGLEIHSREPSEDIDIVATSLEMNDDVIGVWAGKRVRVRVNWGQQDEDDDD